MSQERPGRERSYAPAKVRFYFDADVLGLAKLLVRVRNDMTYPGDPGRGALQARAATMSDRIACCARSRLDTGGHFAGLADRHT